MAGAFAILALLGVLIGVGYRRSRRADTPVTLRDRYLVGLTAFAALFPAMVIGIHMRYRFSYVSWGDTAATGLFALAVGAVPLAVFYLISKVSHLGH